MNAPKRTILITGCSAGGIGYYCAHALRERGWRVFASCRKQADCDMLIGEGFDSPRLDYADEPSLNAGLAEVLAATGGTLDALFNNGAFACPGAVEDIPADALRETFETNFFGLHTLTRLVIPVMRAQGHGRVVQNSSVLGYTPFRWRGAYAASKFALEGLTRVQQLEMRDTPVKVILIQPGAIRSNFRRNAATHFERWVDWEKSARADQYRDTLIPYLYESTDQKDPFTAGPDAVAKVLFKALDAPNPRARYIVTAPAKVIAWAQRLLPERLVNAFLARQ
jgi:NAD(P)-dependent dehydrogenase (short-subunit alcohol dehydrogenase family)